MSTLTEEATALVYWAEGSKNPEAGTADAGDGITLRIEPWAAIETPVGDNTCRVDYGESVRAYVGESWAHESEVIALPDDLTAAAETCIEQVRMSRRAAMPRVLRDLDDITQSRRVVADELARIDTARDDAIIAAIEAGHGAPTIGVHAGLTAARVYQIRDARR